MVNKLQRMRERVVKLEGPAPNDRRVTSKAGTASAAFANVGYTNFGGKSGTAEDAGAQQHVLFVAYAPASAPQAVAAVVLDEGASGSIEAGPIARDIVLAAIR